MSNTFRKTQSCSIRDISDFISPLLIEIPLAFKWHTSRASPKMNHFHLHLLNFCYKLRSTEEYFLYWMQKQYGGKKSTKEGRPFSVKRLIIRIRIISTFGRYLSKYLYIHIFYINIFTQTKIK